jgi:hypothetical protein
MLDEVFEEGTYPCLINFLQKSASSRKLLELERRLAAHRKARYFATRTPYLVSLSETSTIEEIHKRQVQFTERLSRPMVVKSKFEMIVNDQRWINRMFFDAVYAHLKLTVALLLRVPRSENDLLPDQSTINEVFVHCVQKGYLSMAEMLLTGGPVTADQSGFDQALLAALDMAEIQAMEWLLNGRCGFSPTQTFLDELYTQHARRAGPMARQYEWQYVYRLRQRNVTVGRFGRFRLGIEHMRIPADADAIMHEQARSQTITDRLKYRASTEAQQVIARQYKQAETRRLALHQFRMPVGDIHMFSGVAVQEGDVDGNVEGEEMDVADPGEGQNFVQPEVRGGGQAGEVAVFNQGVEQQGLGREALQDAHGEDAGLVAPAALNPWEIPAARGRARRGRLTTHDAVLQNIESRVGTNVIGAAEVTRRIAELIAEHFASEGEQTRTMRYVSRFMSEANVRVLGLALQFITLFHPAAVGMWLQGFLGESVSVNSCHAGAMERIVTGLRGIEDAELQQIFRQAEGPNLARIFLMGTFNIYYAEGDEAGIARAHHNAAQLAVELVRRGVTLQSTEDEVKQRLLQYAREAVNSYRAGLDRVLADSIDTVVLTVVDGYEDYLLPAVREALLEAQRLQEVQLQLMQDGELHEGCCGQESKDETA